MITQTKYRLLIWLVIILFAMNMATVASLVYHTRQTKKVVKEQPSAEQSVKKAEQGARFFREKLNLDPAQTDSFREINREYNRSAHHIAYDLERMRAEMVEQMGVAEPDTVRLNDICREIGHKHEELKKLTVEYYLKMKSSCDENQRAKLNAIFREMVQKEDSVPLQQGRGYRWRGGRE